jgi:NitT/TauT family transport system ATP-binding protein
MVTHAIAEAVFLGDQVVVMSARPGRIAEIVDVTLPRPRSLDMMTTPAFAALVHHVRGLLNMGEGTGGEQ